MLLCQHDLEKFAGNKVLVVDDDQRARFFAGGEITGGEWHLIIAANQRASAGMVVSEYLALEKVKKGRYLREPKNGKYADEYLAMLK